MSPAQVAPAIIYSNEETAIENVPEETEGPQNQVLTQEEPAQSTSETTHEPVNPIEQMEDLTKSVPPSKLNSNDFFQSKTITKVVIKKPIRKFVPSFLAGNLLKKGNTDISKPAKQNKVLKFPPVKKANKNVVAKPSIIAAVRSPQYIRIEWKKEIS